MRSIHAGDDPKFRAKSLGYTSINSKQKCERLGMQFSLPPVSLYIPCGWWTNQTLPELVQLPVGPCLGLFWSVCKQLGEI
jgi:hypothetical protein